MGDLLIVERLRIVYAAGPGDVIGTFQHWLRGRDDPSQVSVTYSGQFYDACKELQMESYIIASSSIPGYLKMGTFTLVHRPILFERCSAPAYHLGQLLSGIGLLLRALRFRADGVVVSNGSANWASLALLRVFGIEVIPSLHCVLWEKSKPLRYGGRVVKWLDSWFFKRVPSSILSASRDITEQIEQFTNKRHARIFEFLPTYRREEFARSESPPQLRSPFRVFYAGRIEKDKGVFDLLEVASRFTLAGRDDIVFDLCGTGSALEELREKSILRNLKERFRLHGQCSNSIMRRMFGQSHVVIVPTTSDFREGFNQVVAEGVLSGRPVITSNVCPALHYVRDAVVEVPPDDVEAYANAILKLLEDVELYEAKRAACIALQSPFYEAERGWGAALREAILLMKSSAGGDPIGHKQQLRL